MGRYKPAKTGAESLKERSEWRKSKSEKGLGECFSSSRAEENQRGKLELSVRKGSLAWAVRRKPWTGKTEPRGQVRGGCHKVNVLAAHFIPLTFFGGADGSK